MDDADPNGTLTTTLAAEPELDPVLTTSAASFSVIHMVFERLIGFDPATLQPVPKAAKALPEVSADGLTYRVTIRDDAKFSDGSPVRAADYANAFYRLCDPAIKAPNASWGFAVVGCAEWAVLDPKTDPPERAQAAQRKLATEGVRATGERELTISLVRPTPDFTAMLGSAGLVPVRASDVAHGGATWTEPATYTGNGPFVLNAWKHGERLVLTPNRYYRNPTKLKQWTRVIIQEPAVILGAYQHDEIDGYFASSAASQGGGAAGTLLREIRGDPKMNAEVVLPPNLCTNALGFNTRRPPFDDPVVRLAFAKAIDREAYVRDVVGGLGTPTLSYLPPGIPGYDAADTAQSFDPAEARRLLASSRYVGTPPMRAIVIPYGLQAIQRTRTEWVRDQWKRVLDVDIKVEQSDGATIGQLYRKGETVPQVFFIGSCSGGNDGARGFLGDEFTSGLDTSIGYYTGAEDPDLVGVLQQAERESDPGKRADLYRRASHMVSERGIVATLNTGRSLSLRKPWVRGIVDSALDIEIGFTAGMEKIYVVKRGR